MQASWLQPYTGCSPFWLASSGRFDHPGGHADRGLSDTGHHHGILLATRFADTKRITLRKAGTSDRFTALLNHRAIASPAATSACVRARRCAAVSTADHARAQRRARGSAHAATSALQHGSDYRCCGCIWRQHPGAWNTSTDFPYLLPYPLSLSSPDTCHRARLAALDDAAAGAIDAIPSAIDPHPVSPAPTSCRFIGLSVPAASSSLPTRLFHRSEQLLRSQRLAA